ncbi:MAG: chromate efflux transporter [Thermomicrobiales bacterium]
MNDESIQLSEYPPSGGPGEVGRLAFKLGCTAFGGPAAHIAMLRREVVEERKWIDEELFTAFLGLTNLIPGPNSTELILLTGRTRAGFRGFLAAAVGFITPAVLITYFFAVLYVRYGTRAGMAWMLYGVKPVIIVIVVHALWGMAKFQLMGLIPLVIAGGAMIGYLASVNELVLLAIAGGAAVVVRLGKRRADAMKRTTISLFAFKTGVLSLSAIASDGVSYGSWRLFWSFLKIGAVLYGSGYVLIAFLRSEFVVKLGWISEQQLLDAVAFGQITPGPVFSTATFVGYLAGGTTGALFATVGIFLPSFIFVLAASRLLRLFTRHEWLMIALGGVIAASLGLMAGVMIELGEDALVDFQTVVIAVFAAFLLFRWKMSSTRLLFLGAVAGLFFNVIA